MQIVIVPLKNAKIVILKKIALIVLGKLVVVGIIFIKDNHLHLIRNVIKLEFGKTVLSIHECSQL